MMSKRPIKLEPLPPPKVEIINLIDVLITLVAFFLLTTVFANDQRQLGIDLPRARQTQAVSAAAPKLLVQMDRSRRLYLNRQPVGEGDLAVALRRQPPNAVVLIEADRACPYGVIVRLVDLVQRSRLTRIGLKVRGWK
ncbi:MAG: biopolymer transporter ExbD [Bacillota bacterium]|jgi:biopolymer transport protein ExbD